MTILVDPGNPRTIRFDPFSNIVSVGWLGPCVFLIGAWSGAEEGHTVGLDSWKLEVPDDFFVEGTIPPFPTNEQVILFHQQAEGSFRAFGGPIVPEPQGSTIFISIIINPGLVAARHAEFFQDEDNVMSAVLDLGDSNPLNGKMRAIVCKGAAIKWEVENHQEDHYRNVVQTSGVDAAIEAMTPPEEFWLPRAVDPLDLTPPPPEFMIAEVASSTDSVVRWSWDFVRRAIDPFPVPTLATI